MHATRACLCLFVLHAAAVEDTTISTNNTRLGTPTYPSNNTNTHLNTNNTFVSAFTASGSGSTIIHVVKTISKISPSQPTQRLSITDSTNIFYDDVVNNAVFSSLSIAATGIHQGNYWTPPPLEAQHHLGESTLMHMMTTTHTPRPEPQQTHGESHLQPNAADTAVMMLCTMPAHSMLFPPDHNDPLPPPFLTNTIAAASKEQDKSEVPQTTTPILPLSDYAGDLISENTSPYIDSDGLDDTLALSTTSVFDAKQPPPPNFF
jgi:hypothetical protein